MRIVALSDQHGHLPDVPPCDLLIVAGDVCPDVFDGVFAGQDPGRQQAWFDQTARQWLSDARARYQVLTWGNHDWCGEGGRIVSDPGGTGLHILVDAVAEIPSCRVGGRPISVWASPWTRAFGHWAFMKSPEQLVELYATIPEGTDILVTHQPPWRHGDTFVHSSSGRVEHPGSPELLDAIDRVKPRLVICGHMHDGFGQFDYRGVPIWNVSVVNDDYELVRTATVIDVEDW